MWAGLRTGLQTVAVPAKLDDCRASLRFARPRTNELSSAWAASELAPLGLKHVSAVSLARFALLNEG